MAREIDRVKIEEIHPDSDRYAGVRCGVCGHPWEVHPEGETCSRYRPAAISEPDPVILVNLSERNGYHGNG